MKRIYIFVTVSIYKMGGMQTYTAAKAEYLRHAGWEVRVVYADIKRKLSQFKELNNYRDGSFPELSIQPAKLPEGVVNDKVKSVIRLVGDYKTYDTIILESHNDRTSQWGELIAQQIGAKHIIILLNEFYREPKQCYADKIDFYFFKFKRKEILSNFITLQRLFDGFLEIKENDVNLFKMNESPVQDIDNPKVEAIGKLDFNICYIGRPTKTYVSNVLLGVKEFSVKHKDKKIQFILVCDSNLIRESIEHIFAGIGNLSINEMGELVPIPKALYKKVDVVIAGSGCARCSADAGALTIVAETESCEATGVLGIDTQESVYWDGKSHRMSFKEALEKVLIEEAYAGKTIDYSDLSVAECIKDNFKAIDRTDQVKVYYDRNKLLEGEKKIYLKLKIKYFLLTKAPGVLHFYRAVKNALTGPGKA